MFQKFKRVSAPQWRLATAGILAGFMFAVAPTGCSRSSKTSVETKTTTVGEELADLDKARNDGLLTEREYHEQREAILKRAKE